MVMCSIRQNHLSAPYINKAVDKATAVPTNSTAQVSTAQRWPTGLTKRLTSRFFNNYTNDLPTYTPTISEANMAAPWSGKASMIDRRVVCTPARAVQYIPFMTITSHT